MPTITYHNVEQRSDAWFEIRKDAFITGSNVNEILRPRETKTYESLVFQKAYRYTKRFENAATLHGIKNEVRALELFKALTGKQVQEVGFVTNSDYPNMGVSPDGLIDNDAVLELKCPYSRKIEQGILPPSYYHQVQLQLLITNRPVAYYFEIKINGLLIEEYNLVKVRKSYRWAQQNLHKLYRFIEDVKRQRNHCVLDTMCHNGFIQTHSEERPQEELPQPQENSSGQTEELESYLYSKRPIPPSIESDTFLSIETISSESSGHESA